MLYLVRLSNLAKPGPASIKGAIIVLCALSLFLCRHNHDNHTRYMMQLLFDFKIKNNTGTFLLLESLPILKHLKTHITQPFTYTGHVCAGINRQQIVYSVLVCSNNSLPPTLTFCCSRLATPVIRYLCCIYHWQWRCMQFVFFWKWVA